MDAQKPFALSLFGARFIESEEGYRGKPYNDSQNNATVGIGHLIHMGPVTEQDTLAWTLSYKQALKLLQEDMERVGLQALREHIQVDLTQAQVDALCSLAFNCGPGCLEGHVKWAVNAKPKRWNLIAMRNWHNSVKVAIMLYAHPVELTRRRNAEAWLFNTGKYFHPANPYSHAGA
jgi:GH24 family phage-related lysozyme (muramidase)